MPDRKAETTRRREVLEDHKRIGKRFIPPFLYQIGRLSEVSWVDEIMPELIWIGLLIDRYGYRQGVELGLQLSKSAISAYKSEKCEFFAWLSSFERLSEEQREILVRNLEGLDILSDISDGLRPLLSLYPDCPLCFLADHPMRPADNDLDLMKNIVEKLYARRDVFATRVQATAIYFAFVAGCLEVAEGTSLADFPEVEKYPDTEESKRVAASVRASLNFLYGVARDRHSTEWPLIFWNRGLALEGCRSITEVWEEQSG